MRPLKSALLHISCVSFLVSVITAQLDCDILDPACRAKYRSGARHSDVRRRLNHKCNYQDIWLVPGRADASCSKFSLALERTCIIKT
uniref:Secreted protein n=1 Tax=Caenorhabditis japonica TaxID=281687 RepID=A0A8R1IT67_CAEJA